MKTSISLSMKERSKQKRKPTSRDLISISSRRWRESLRIRRSKNTCWRPTFHRKIQAKSGLETSNDLVVIAGWLGRNNNPVCDILLSKILNQWLISWKKRGIPLTIFLKHWEGIITRHSLNSSSTEELV